MEAEIALTLTDSDVIDFTSNFSIEAWFNPSSNGMILNKEDSYLLKIPKWSD